MSVLSPAAFLVEIGKVLIAQQIIADSKEGEFKEALEDLSNVEAAEREIVGTDTPEVSATIFKHWKFESSLIDVIGNCLNPENAKSQDNQRAAKILHVVRVAVTLQAQVTDESIAEAKELIETYKLDMESFDKALENMR
jgi:HD-like signal output (HDOD) protein